LRAEVLLWRGLDEKVLSLLAESLPSRFAATDFATRRQACKAIAHGHLHQFEQAQAALADAEQLANTKQPQLLGEVFLAKGSVALARGALGEALSFFQVAWNQARLYKQPFLETNAAGSLGRTLVWLEHYDAAIDWFTNSLQLSQSLNARASSAKTLGNIGWSYREMGDLENALSQFVQAESAAHGAGLVVDEARWLSSVGDVYYDLHNYSAAQINSSEALKLADSLHDSDVAIYCLQNLALISLARKQFDAARKNIDDALRREAPAPDHTRELYTRLIAADLAANTGSFAKAETSYVEIIADSASPASVRWEAQAGLAQTHAARGKLILAEREFTQAINTISAARDSIQHEDFRLSFLSSAIRFYDQYVNFLLSQDRPLDALKIADLSRAQTLEHGLSPSANADAGGKTPALPKSASAFAIHPQETARRLGATLLFYQLGQEGSHLWVISPEKITLRTLPSAGEIEALVGSYRRSILEDPRDLLESVSASGKKLYELLIQPVENAIPEGSRVIVLPDGPLRSLNFESLPVYGANPHYWIEDATISVASSLSLLSHVSNSRRPKSPNLLLFGDPDPPTNEFPRLGDARDEIHAVQSHFDEKSTTLFLKKDARASLYLSSDPGKYSYLHFATHGIASVAKPLESAIILTREGDSYKLYARDIVQHRLNAYLVSISACDGSGRRNFAGEGLIGLSWAFLRAGAHNVVAGLWETSTASTPPIFDRLYQGVTHGEDPATALRNAKLALVHAKGASRRPFYWAPFQLYVGS